MPTLPAGRAPHEAREIAEAFGSDPDRYDRARPRYPDALVEAIVAASPGRAVLDVGCGTGIAARQFEARGCDVLGVDPDARMAAFARDRALAVDVAPFEAWEPAGRTFDAVIAGQTWHWVDPDAGAVKAARVLRPGGRLALFWNMFRPAPDLAAAFAAVHERVVPGHPRNPWARRTLDAYAPILAAVAGGVRAAGAFDPPEEWRFHWERGYSRDEWLEQVATGGDASRLEPPALAALLDGLGAEVDARGGRVTMPYTAVAVTAARR